MKKLVLVLFLAALAAPALAHTLAAKVTPFPAPKQVHVAVNGAAVKDPKSYLRLFTVGQRTDAYPKSDDFVQITFQSTPPTPWTTRNDIVLYTVDRLLMRDGELVSISRSMSDRIADGASLAPGSRVPWRLLALGLAPIAGLV